MVALGLFLAAPAFGDEERTRTIVANICAACHGLDGNSTIPTFPKLAGRRPDYIVRELKEFVSGKRKSDVMAPIAATLDPNDFQVLGDYFGTQKPTSGAVLDEKMAKIGEKLYLNGDERRGVPACGGCHYLDGGGYWACPRVVGQHREYLIEQMRNYQKDIRRTEFSYVMREVAKRLTDDEIRAVAEFLAGQ